MLPKICVTFEKASNKSCSELDFVQKSAECICLSSPKSGAWGLQRLIRLKYNIVIKRENTLTLGLNAAKNMHIEFCTKSPGCVCPSSHVVELGGSKD